jgi:hypothetical protein
MLLLIYLVITYGFVIGNIREYGYSLYYLVLYFFYLFCYEIKEIDVAISYFLYELYPNTITFFIAYSNSDIFFSY